MAYVPILHAQSEAGTPYRLYRVTSGRAAQLAAEVADVLLQRPVGTARCGLRDSSKHILAGKYLSRILQQQSQDRTLCLCQGNLRPRCGHNAHISIERQLAARIIIHNVSPSFCLSSIYSFAPIRALPRNPMTQLIAAHYTLLPYIPIGRKYSLMCRFLWRKKHPWA